MNSSPFASPLGPLHFAHPSQATQFVLPLPSSSRIRSFFRTSSSSSSKPSQAKKQPIKVEYEDPKGSTFTPFQTPSSPPPSYRQAVDREEDLYCEDVESSSERDEFDKKRQALIEEDKRMDQTLRSIGF